MNYYKIYCWENKKGADGYLENIDDNEHDIHGTSYLYTTDSFKCQKLVEKYPGSKYYLVTDIKEINDYDNGLDENEGGHYIEVNNIKYKFMGSYRDNNGDWNWGWVKIEEYVEYDHKCKHCKAMLHVDCNYFVHGEDIVCEECFESESYTITECCGAVFHQNEYEEKYLNIINGEQDLNKFEVVSVCRECLDKNNIIIDLGRLGNDDEYDKEIFKMASSL